ncbi:SpoIIAA family protein [Methyloligella solikamskensis]|uniref:STAS/SEC14 domain-containing protein n=1 Tax=Methyloligella solikamskensis TaxID=1177756 RepID=A0ABW3JCM0_9HYPH
MIEMLEGFPDNIVAVAYRGEISAEDYEKVLVPAVEKCLKEYGKIRLYAEIGSDLKGIDAGAAFEDFSVGMKNYVHWERVAVVTDHDWIANAVRFFSFMMPGAMKPFAPSDKAAATEWLEA